MEIYSVKNKEWLAVVKAFRKYYRKVFVVLGIIITFADELRTCEKCARP